MKKLIRILGGVDYESENIIHEAWLKDIISFHFNNYVYPHYRVEIVKVNPNYFKKIDRGRRKLQR